MVITKIINKSEIVLTITLKKAKWLKNIMQNPLCGQSFNDETFEDETNRNEFWIALQGIDNGFKINK